MRRHWQLVCCAFSLCWWARTPARRFARGSWPRWRTLLMPSEPTGRGEKEAPGILAEGVEGGERVAGAVDNARAILESIYRSAPAQRVRECCLSECSRAKGSTSMSINNKLTVSRMPACCVDRLLVHTTWVKEHFPQRRQRHILSNVRYSAVLESFYTYVLTASE